ncbi:MAG: NAD-dependent epimerase/dehydratase family protein [Alphaproteobacteria bacterium]|jgi:UDP-glucose 4-epimerase|nr:NAD-dependent epimerase/dehydratase family protein [Rhodospirillaceae bacterium]MBT7613208.1 NAD-dependent epimerase/dehydratase family protein [Rhodospirillaceae bacterium]MBT7648203.1 NAD-dependent epimerase/dehydratase family protein [Rhodospirillaceae bacterium]MDG2483077.1 NAD-dependent epimerase/dehydratase family protein [Alphaproteobacteria bacterium]
MTQPLSGRTCAVTGGGGLIGSFLVDDLLALEARVVVVDDFSKGRRENLAHHGKAVETREVDLEIAGTAADALEGCDVVFHLASRAFGVGHGAGRHWEILQHNEAITNNVLDALARLRPSHVLVASSSCVHRDDGPDTVGELPLFDGEPEIANWGYGWAKRFLEQKAAIMARETGIACTIVRPFNIYGERYAWQGTSSQAIPMLVKKAMDGEDPVVMWGSGEQRRTYLHAADCAAIMRRLVETAWHDGPVNIGMAETVTVRELVETICRVAGLSPELIADTSKPEGRFVKSNDPARLLQAVPGFVPTVSLEEGIGRMAEWYRREFA